jgi:hypothetical protein
MVFFLYVQEDPSAISTAVDVLAHTEAGGKKADRLQLDVDPKLLVSSKSRVLLHIVTSRRTFRRSGRYVWIMLHGRGVSCLTISTHLHSQQKPSASQPLPLEMEEAEENELGLLRRLRPPLLGRLGPRRGVKVPCLFVSQIILEISKKFLRNYLERNFLDNYQIFSDFLRFLTLSLISVQEGVTYPSTLDASRLKVVFRSVDSDSESSSEAKKTRLHFLRKYNEFLRKSGRKI